MKYFCCDAQGLGANESGITKHVAVKKRTTLIGKPFIYLLCHGGA